MHEYGLMEAVVARALEEARRGGATSVTQVSVDVGELAFADRESLETAFRSLAGGTLLEGAALELREVRARIRCEGCGLEGSAEAFDLLGEHETFVPFCVRCGGLLTVREGRGVTLVRLALVVPDPSRFVEEAKVMGAH